MMTFVSHEMAPGLWMQESYQSMPDINGGPNRLDVLSPMDLQATFPGIVQTARGEYTGDLGYEGPAGRPVHLGQDGWMVGQAGCMMDSQSAQGSGMSSVDLPDMSWCGVNDWVDRNKGLAMVGLVALFVGTRAGARKIRERRAARK